jgi:hypothetical protein
MSFLIDLGDTFMSEKVSNAKYDDIVGRYLELRSYFSLISHSVPLFLVIGNHDGEQGRSLNGTANNITVWATNLRKLYYPNPIPDNFYTGNTIIEDFVGLPQDYYAWEWGDALFIVLDPYRYTIPKSGKSPDGWEWTLGRNQYDWFRQTLENSESKFKFVFSHHLVGGSTNARGGIEFAKYYEWGGLNKDGSWGFDENRPGWGKPIHQLMVENKVSIFFHGHDHFFDKQDLDGIVYQLVPQPSHESNGKPSQALEYGYTGGIILPPAGHIRATISGSKVIVDYVQALLPKNERDGHINGEVAYSYIVVNDSSPKSKLYDINGDGIIDLSDLNMAVISFGKIGDNLIADVNKDGKVDIIDLILISRHFEE